MATVYTGSCDFKSLRDLVPFDQNPTLNLTSFVGTCGQVCTMVYGNGNPDLTGIGVIVSYALQLGLAVLFGPVLIVYRFVAPDSCFVTWVEKRQGLNLWSQLYFSLAISLACFVRLYQQQGLGPSYEAAVIFMLVGFNLINFLLSMAAFYQPIRRPAMFVFSAASIYALSAFAELLPVIRRRYFDRMLGACQELAQLTRQPWSHSVVGPFEGRLVAPRVFTLAGLTVTLNIAWVLERRLVLRRSGRVQRRQYCKHTVEEWAVQSTLLFVSTTLAGFAIQLLARIMAIRWSIDRESGGRTGENVWGVGQVCAPFAWAPMFVEMVYN